MRQMPGRNPAPSPMATHLGQGRKQGLLMLNCAGVIQW